MRRTLFSFVLLGTTAAYAADQTILGSQLLVKNPNIPAKRKLSGKAKEKASTNTLVGDPTVSGGSLTVSVDGTTPSEQTFPLPQGMNAKGKPFWSGDATKGYSYKDSKGENGVVTAVKIKKSPKGVFQIQFKADGKLGTLSVVPPNVGTEGCVLLELSGGDSYSVLFDDGKITNKGTAQFQVKNPTTEGTCVSAPAIQGPAFPPPGGNVSYSYSGGGAGDPGGGGFQFFDFTPDTSWSALYWGPSSAALPTSSLDGTPHALTFSGIAGTTATWAGTTTWFNPGDSTLYTGVPLELRVTITGLGATPWVLTTSIPGMDPGPGSGAGAVVDDSSLADFGTNVQFLADIPTDGSGNFIALNTVPGGNSSSSYTGGFYTIVP